MVVTWYPRPDGVAVIPPEDRLIAHKTRGGYDKVECPGCGAIVKPFVMVDLRGWPASFWTANNMTPLKWACDACWQQWDRDGLEVGDGTGAVFDESYLMEFSGADPAHVQRERDNRDRLIDRFRGEAVDGRIRDPGTNERRMNRSALWKRDASDNIVRDANGRPQPLYPEKKNLGAREKHSERKARLRGP